MQGADLLFRSDTMFHIHSTLGISMLSYSHTLTHQWNSRGPKDTLRSDLPNLQSFLTNVVD